ncbi:MAG: hypothetical protein ACK559_08395 [bacterium]
MPPAALPLTTVIGRDGHCACVTAVAGSSKRVASVAKDRSDGVRGRSKRGACIGVSSWCAGPGCTRSSNGGDAGVADALVPVPRCAGGGRGGFRQPCRSGCAPRRRPRVRRASGSARNLRASRPERRHWPP